MSAPSPTRRATHFSNHPLTLPPTIIYFVQLFIYTIYTSLLCQKFILLYYVKEPNRLVIQFNLYFVQLFIFIRFVLLGSLLHMSHFQFPSTKIKSVISNYFHLYFSIMSKIEGRRIRYFFP